MQQVKKQILGGIDGDSSFKLVDNKCAINIMNARVGISEKGKLGPLQSIPGTTIISQSVHAATGINRPLGSTVDLKRNRLVYALCNSLGNHGIFAYDLLANTTYAILLDNQVSGGLNFSLNNRINRNMHVVGDLLFFTDGFNEPRCINTERGIKLNHASYVTSVTPYTFPLKYTTVTLIKRPPIFAPLIAKATDSGYVNNFIQDKAYQFTYRYTYVDFQTSALSAYSKLAALNFKADTFNRINVSIPLTELIDDDIFQIDLCVRYGNFGKTFIIKSWDKNSDAAAITAHNAGTALTYAFFDDKNGTALDDVTANTPFDSVPLLALTECVARNRLFLGKIRQGYSTPAQTSLAISVANANTGNAGTHVATWKYVNLSYMDLNTQVVSQIPYYYAYDSALSPSTIFFFDASRNNINPSPSYDSTTATSTWNSEINFAYYITRNYAPPAGTQWVNFPVPTFNSTGNTTNLIIPAVLGAVQFFKSNSTYKVSIAFYDRFRRKCGYVKQFQQAVIPIRTYNQSVFSSLINWTLSNSAAAAEIPEWAYYYQIHISKNQTTRSFLQITAADAVYVTKDSTTGVLKNNKGAYAAFDANSIYATAFDLTPLTAYGMGYTFSPDAGDELIVYKTDGTSITLPVIGTNGSFVMVKPTNIGDLSGINQSVIEIYTPYTTSSSEPLYETGEVYTITNPTLANRTYSTLSGTINGDCYAIQRDKGASQLYYTEAMSPNDKFWKVWQTDTGWVNVIDTIGQKDKDNSFVFSDTFIAGTKTNGLNKFQPLNQKDLDSDSGILYKLQLASKIESEGTVMLAICANQPYSIYLGETQLTASSGQGYVAKSDDVVGSINALIQSSGTVTPETVVAYNGLVFWIDTNNGYVNQYSGNGIDEVGKNRMSRFFKRYCKDYQATSSATIDGISGFHHIPTAINPFTKEFLVTTPGLITEASATQFPSYSSLPDYATSIINRFDVYDQLEKTMSYNVEGNMWGNTYEFAAEWYDYVSNVTFGFKNGNWYKMHTDTTNYNTFFGVKKPIRLCLSLNEIFSADRELENIVIEGSDAPTFTVAYSNNPDIQITDLVQADFRKLGTSFFSNFYRDRLSPNITGAPEVRMMIGDHITGYPILIQLEWNLNTSLVSIDAVNLGFLVSKGLQQIIQK